VKQERKLVFYRNTESGTDKYHGEI